MAGINEREKNGNKTEGKREGRWRGEILYTK
jgi:hypothetical protein